MPPTLITSSREEVIAFRREHKDIIVKPLFGNGGAARKRAAAPSRSSPRKAASQRSA